MILFDLSLIVLGVRVVAVVAVDVDDSGVTECMLGVWDLFMPDFILLLSYLMMVGSL